MFDLNKIIRPNIKALTPYSSARDEFKGSEGIFLDANENPYGNLNRYPDPYQRELKQGFAELKNVSTNQIFVGNGSDETIDLLFRIFCQPGKDKALTFSPTYGMYNVAAEINDVELIEIPLNDEFEIDYESVKPSLNDPNLKLILICSPNNPTGNCFNTNTIEKIIENFNGIVLIDEAYIDFSSRDSLISLISKYPNLIVSQTMSKSWGLAAARIGLAFTSIQIIQLFNRVKPPYNISKLNQLAAIEALKNYTSFITNKELVIAEKAKLIEALDQLSIAIKTYPSEANFLLVEFENSATVYESLIQRNIIVRNRAKQVKNCIRISVGTPEENQKLIKALNTI